MLETYISGIPKEKNSHKINQWLQKGLGKCETKNSFFPTESRSERSDMPLVLLVLLIDFGEMLLTEFMQGNVLWELRFNWLIFVYPAFFKLAFMLKPYT